MRGARPVVKILIVDDHKMFCDGLRLILRQLEGATEVLVADRASEAIRLVADHPDIDLVMLDINLPDGDGVDGKPEPDPPLFRFGRQRLYSESIER
jgi:DNA-binding NarL/FixJ family response regulator